MTHDELVEKVARSNMTETNCGFTLESGERVLCDDERVEKFLDPAGRTYRQDKCTCRAEARAAIASIYEAMKEPTPEMIDAAMTDFVLSDDCEKVCWQVMLDASPLNGGDNASD